MVDAWLDRLGILIGEVESGRVRLLNYRVGVIVNAESEPDGSIAERLSPLRTITLTISEGE